MLLSIDWDYFVGMCEHVFDSPFWGTPDREFHRLERWRQLTLKRDPTARGFDVLCHDFPLLELSEILLQFKGIPVFSALSHESAWEWLEMFPAESEVLNLDSHHDLYSQSGDENRVRPGNWAGLALEVGRISSYTCIYPNWHSDVRLTEGYDLERTRAEITQAWNPALLRAVNLMRGSFPESLNPSSVLIVQSPSWTNPFYDSVLENILCKLEARAITPVLKRVWTKA